MIMMKDWLYSDAISRQFGSMETALASELTYSATQIWFRGQILKNLQDLSKT